MDKSIKSDLKAADAKSAAGFAAAGKAVTAALDAAAKESSKKFGEAYAKMGAQRAALDASLAGAVADINDSIAKQAALADSRFKKTVKDISAARKEAAAQVKSARKDFA